MDTTNSKITPLKFPKALRFFVVAAVPFYIGIYIIIPNFVNEKSNAFLPFSAAILIPLFLLLMYAVVLGIHESKLSTWLGLMERWHLKKLTKKDGLYTLFLIAIIFLGYFGLASTSDWILENFPALNPPRAFELIRTPNSFFGLPLQGNWWILALHFGILLLNVLGEELFFRGIILPKQQKVHKQYTWIVHGLCYHLFHMFYPWDFFRLLPESLAYAFVAQKTGNTWTTIIAHFTFNGLGLIGTVYGIMS